GSHPGRGVQFHRNVARKWSSAREGRRRRLDASTHPQRICSAGPSEGGCPARDGSGGSNTISALILVVAASAVPRKADLPPANGTGVAVILLPSAALGPARGAHPWSRTSSPTP